VQRYSFHIFNGHPHPDLEGTELAGLEKACQKAIQTAGEIILVTTSKPGRARNGTWKSPTQQDNLCSDFASLLRS
jgi:hypothetical protein